MKPVNIGVLTGSLGKRSRSKNLREIFSDVAATKMALNPYTITASRIVKNLHHYFIFPFLQPTIVNPLGLEINDESYNRKTDVRYLRDKRVQISQAMGMDAPSDQSLIVPYNGRPRFVARDELSTKQGELQYRVFDYESFKQFIPQLIKDMSFLRPMHRQSVNEALDAPQLSDLVVLRNQNAWKLARVVGIEQKDYLAKFFSPSGFLASRIGVSNENLHVGMGDLDYEFELMISDLNLNWAEQIPCDSRLPIGSAAQVFGLEKRRFQEDKYTLPLGYASIIGLEEKCAIVEPFIFENDKWVWGYAKNLAIPLSDLWTIGSMQQITADNLYDYYFADDGEVMSCIGDVTKDEMDNTTVRSVISFCDMNRYRRLHDDLHKCPEVPSELISSQFVKILAQNGLDGLDRLAKITGMDATELGIDMLAHDLVAPREALLAEGKAYRSFVPLVNELVSSTTSFESLEQMLRSVGPKIRLYQMPRDGLLTLAYIDSLQISKTIWETDDDWHYRVVNMTTSSYSREKFDRDKKKGHTFGGLLREKNLEKHPRLKINFEQHLSRSFLSKEKVPAADSWMERDGGTLQLYGVNYCILNKPRSVRYGRDEEMKMTYPGLENIDERFSLHVSTNFQYHFIVSALERVKRHSVFDGKDKFFKGLPAVKEAIKTNLESNDQCYHGWRHDTSVTLMDKMRPFYDGVRQLAKTPALRDALALAALKDEPLLLEAFYDLENMGKMIMIRDHFWRGHVPEKEAYLNQFGYRHELPDSGFADEFYRALAEIDMYHRGFPLSEDYVSEITRGRQEGRHKDRASSLGLYPSSKADLLLKNMQQRIASTNTSLPLLLE